MRFWDASAVIPLCVSDPNSETMRKLAREDEAMVVWWGTIVECHSAFSRLRRVGDLEPSGRRAGFPPAGSSGRVLVRAHGG